MPAFLERKLKSRYGAKSAIPYKILNSLGYMRGSKETAAGRRVQRKHEEKSGHTNIGRIMEGQHAREKR